MNDNDKAHRVKRAAYNTAYYEAHKNEFAAYSAAYYEVHKDEIAAYRKAHKEEKTVYNAIYYKTHKKERAAYNAAYHKANKDKLAVCAVAYRKAHKNKIAVYDTAYRKARLKTDPNFKLIVYLRNRINVAVRSNQKAGSAVRDLGCTIPAFRNHIERQFKKGMTWDNWGEWQLDHIRPLSSFDLTNREQFLQAAHYTNYQPLWASENFSKGANL